MKILRVQQTVLLNGINNKNLLYCLYNISKIPAAQEHNENTFKQHSAVTNPDCVLGQGVLVMMLDITTVN